MRQVLAVTAGSLILTLGCAPADAPPTQDLDLEAERTSLMEADRALFEAYSTSDSPADTLAALAATDAVVLAPDLPMARTKDEIRAVFTALEEMPGYSLTWSPSTATVGGAGDLGYTIGTYHLGFESPEGIPLEVDGKYLTVWKKQPDGGWKLAVDMFNADGVPTPAEGSGS